MRNFTLFLLCFFVFQGNISLKAEELLKEQRIAVVIGNYKYIGHSQSKDENDKKLEGKECDSEYQYKAIPNDANPPVFDDLPNVLNDACDMRQKLLELGFEVRLLLNANRDQMYSAIYYLFNKEKQKAKKNVNLLYFSGHGTDQGENYYLMSSTAEPVCTNEKCFDEFGIKRDDIYELIEHMMKRFKKTKDEENNNLDDLKSNKKGNKKGNKPEIYRADELFVKKYLNFVILDACRDGNRKDETAILKKRQPPDYTFFAFATALNESSSAGSTKDRNSRYTEHLLKFISKPGLPVTEMFARVNLSVEKDTEERNKKAKKDKAQCKNKCEHDEKEIREKCKNKEANICDVVYSVPEIQKPHIISGELKDETNFVFKKEFIDQVPHW